MARKGIILAWMALVVLSSQAFGDVSREAVQSLMDRHGKEKVIQAILKVRHNRITVQVRDKMREFTGPPAPEFVTVDTIARDLDAASVDPKRLEETIASLSAPASTQPRFSPARISPSTASPPRRNTLWSVKTGKNTLYLLGSVHILRRDSYPLSRGIERAYEQSQRVVFEADVQAMASPDMLQKMMAEGLYAEGKSLAQGISRETYELLRKRAESAGLPMAQLERMRPWFCALSLVGIELQRLGFEPAYGVDHHYFKRAKKDGKECLFLETPGEQLSFLSALEEKVQEAFLAQTLAYLDAVGGMFHEMIEAWKTGDVAKLESLVQMGFKDFPELYERLFAGRNRAWLKTVEELLDKDEDALVIVGAGHLVGRESLIDLLSKKGYQVAQR